MLKEPLPGPSAWAHYNSASAGELPCLLSHSHHPAWAPAFTYQTPSECSKNKLSLWETIKKPKSLSSLYSYCFLISVPQHERLISTWSQPDTIHKYRERFKVPSVRAVRDKTDAMSLSPKILLWGISNADLNMNLKNHSHFPPEKQLDQQQIVIFQGCWGSGKEGDFYYSQNSPALRDTPYQKQKVKLPQEENFSEVRSLTDHKHIKQKREASQQLSSYFPKVGKSSLRVTRSS